MNFIDLFAGIGGFRLGMEKAGHKCLAYCEIDKFARKTYEANFDTMGETKWTDITKVTDEEIEEFGKQNRVDVICGGFPCQPFSIAGKRKGYEDTRGTLFFEIMRFAKILKPKHLFLENVKGILSNGGGQRLQEYFKRWMPWGMTVNGSCLTAKILECRKIEKECSLSDILEENVPDKYFLSPQTQAKILANFKS